MHIPVSSGGERGYFSFTVLGTFPAKCSNRPRDTGTKKINQYLGDWVKKESCQERRLESGVHFLR
jgi:hypothetical protein